MKKKRKNKKWDESIYKLVSLSSLFFLFKPKGVLENKLERKEEEKNCIKGRKRENFETDEINEHTL